MNGSRQNVKMQFSRWNRACYLLLYSSQCASFSISCNVARWQRKKPIYCGNQCETMPEHPTGRNLPTFFPFPLDPPPPSFSPFFCRRPRERSLAAALLPQPGAPHVPCWQTPLVSGYNALNTGCSMFNDLLSEDTPTGKQRQRKTGRTKEAEGPRNRSSMPCCFTIFLSLAY